MDPNTEFTVAEDCVWVASPAFVITLFQCDEYFNPLDKEVEMIMKVTLDGEDKSMKEMVKTIQRQAILEKAEAEKIANVRDADAKQHIQDISSSNSPGKKGHL